VAFGEYADISCVHVLQINQAVAARWAATLQLDLVKDWPDG